jgi:hypothetical protein
MTNLNRGMRRVTGPIMDLRTLAEDGEGLGIQSRSGCREGLASAQGGKPVAFVRRWRQIPDGVVAKDTKHRAA